MKGRRERHRHKTVLEANVTRTIKAFFQHLDQVYLPLLLDLEDLVVEPHRTVKEAIVTRTMEKSREKPMENDFLSGSD